MMQILKQKSYQSNYRSFHQKPRTKKKSIRLWLSLALTILSSTTLINIYQKHSIRFQAIKYALSSYFSFSANESNFECFPIDNSILKKNLSSKHLRQALFLKLRSFQIKSQAQAFMADLILEGFSPKLEIEQEQQGIIYSVLLGPFWNEDAKAKALENFTKTNRKSLQMH